MLMADIWAAFMAVFSQDLFAPDPAPSCSVQWVGLENSLGWEMWSGVGTQVWPPPPKLDYTPGPWAVCMARPRSSASCGVERSGLRCLLYLDWEAQ